MSNTAQIATGYIEMPGNHRNASGTLIGTPLSIGINQGRLNVTRAGGDTRLLTGTSSINVGAGVIGAGGGAANDTALIAVVILKNATAATLIITGMQDEAGSAQSITLTGSTTQDTVYALHGIVNGKGPMTLQASIAHTCLVSVQPN